MNEDDEENYPDGFDEISDEEEEDFTIHQTDALIACTTAQDDFSNIEVYIFDEISQSLYVHHDIMLSAYPLCIEWLPLKTNQKANYAIVGSFLPEIEIWNLDIQDALEPDLTLGKVDAEDSDKYYKKNLKKKKKNLSKNKNNADLKYVHTDAVISLNVNPFNCASLVSGGADSKVLFWDLNANPSKAVNSVSVHTDKVQCVKWNKREDNVLLTGSFDKTIKLFDPRSPENPPSLSLSSDIESLDWSSVNKNLFLSSYENGKIDLWDMRKFDTIASFQAHKKAATSVTFSNKYEGLFASVGSDSHVKIWDAGIVADNTTINSAEPMLICEKFVKKTTGELFCAKFSEDLDYTLAVGGSNGELFIWQLEENPAFCNRYGLKWEEAKIPEKFNNISKKRMMSNRIGFKNEKKFNKKKGYK